MQSHTTTLDVPTPFSLRATVLSHGWHECSPMSWCEGGRCLQIIDRISESAIRLSVTVQARTRRTVTLLLRIEGADIAKEDVAPIRDRLRVMLNVDHDLKAFYALCRAHPTLKVMPRIGAGRMLRSASMTENIIKTLCATNVNWTQAVKMINRVGQLGPYVPHFRNLTAWPTAREILRAGEGYLRDVCRLGYRVPAMLEFCEDVCAGRRNPDELFALAGRKDVTTAELLARLLTIKGIGPSSAHFLLSLIGRYEHLSIDSATIAHVARTHTNGKKPTIKRIEQIYKPYGEWRNLVWWFESWLTWGTAKTIARDERPRRHSAPNVAES